MPLQAVFLSSPRPNPNFLQRGRYGWCGRSPDLFLPSGDVVEWMAWLVTDTAPNTRRWCRLEPCWSEGGGGERRGCRRDRLPEVRTAAKLISSTPTISQCMMGDCIWSSQGTLTAFALATCMVLPVSVHSAKMPGHSTYRELHETVLIPIMRLKCEWLSPSTAVQLRKWDVMYLIISLHMNGK